MPQVPGRAINLTAALALAALGDLVLHRVASRLFLGQRPTGLGRVVADAGLFASYLGAILGLGLLGVALAGAFRRNELFPRSMRLTVGTVAIFFVVLGAVRLFSAPMPERFLVHLKTGQAFLAWFIAAALWRAPVGGRVKLGVTLFALPAVLHAASLFGERMGLAQAAAFDLARAAELTALVAAALSPFLLAGERQLGLRRALGLAVGIVVLTTVVTAMALAFDLVHGLALYGWRLDLPAPLTAGALAYAALFAAAATGLAIGLVWTLGERGAGRLCGWGLLLIAVAGFQTVAPNPILFATCGLLGVALGAVRVASPGATPAAPAAPLGAASSGA